MNTRVSDPMVDDIPAAARDSERLLARFTDGGWVVLGEREALIATDTFVNAGDVE